MLERASGNLWATSFETQTPFATAWGNEGECWMLLGTSQPLGVRANQNQCLNAFGNRWATTSDIETPCNRLGDQHQCRGALWEPLGHQLRYPDSLCSRWGNQSQWWNALWNLWATNSDIETPPTTAWGIKANVGMRFGNLRAHLRNPDSPCNRSGESRAMLECFWEPLGHSSDIQTLLATAWGIKANVGMCFGNL